MASWTYCNVNDVSWVLLNSSASLHDDDDALLKDFSTKGSIIGEAKQVQFILVWRLGSDSRHEFLRPNNWIIYKAGIG